MSMVLSWNLPRVAFKRRCKETEKRRKKDVGKLGKGN